MARTFRLDNAASDLSLGGAFTHKLGDTAAGTDEITASNAGGVNSGFYATPANDPSSNGTSTGTFTAVLNVSGSSGSTQARCYLRRVNSAGTQQAEVVSPTGYVSTATTGDKTWSWTNPALGTWAAGDRLVLRVEVQNNNAHGGSVGPTFNLVAANTRVDTPFTLADARLTVSFFEFEIPEAAAAPTELAPTGLAQTRALGDLTVSSAFNLAPASIAQTRVVGAPVVNPSVALAGLTRTRTLGIMSILMIQFIRPDADIDAGGWTPEPASPTTLHDKVSDESDSSYITATAA